MVPLGLPVPAHVASYAAAKDSGTFLVLDSGLNSAASR